MRRLALLACALLGTLVVPAVASAGTPDGSGPWADTVTAFSQGLARDGSPVLAARSDPTQALGPAENPPYDPSANPQPFVSLGFGGSITLGYDNVVCNGSGNDLDLQLVESTQEPYPPELVDVYVSKDGTSWTLAQSAVNKDASIPIPLTYARYVKLVDVSNPNDPAYAKRPDADGYDVDGVQALHNNDCVVTNGRMTGGATVYNGNDSEAHAFVLHCDASDGPNALEVVWKHHWFHLSHLDSAICTNDPSLDESPPNAGFDTYDGTGTGYLNGRPGATATWTFTDDGEPGRHVDRATIVIKDSDGNVVLDSSDTIDCGNQQAHSH